MLRIRTVIAAPPTKRVRSVSQLPGPESQKTVDLLDGPSGVLGKTQPLVRPLP
jgi:hypothetical protein